MTGPDADAEAERSGEGPGGAAPPTIRRFTTEYDAEEDRIRLTLERAEGGPVRLWLTRRLLVKAVPELVKVLDTRLVTPEGLPAHDGAAGQRRDQLAALGRMQPQRPVRPAPGEQMADHLITGIGLRLKRTALLLDMKRGEEVVQTVPFGIGHMRQWLALLNQCFRMAGWEDPIWPDWLTPPPPGESPPGVRLN